MSGKKRRAALDAIKDACETFINGQCLTGLSEIASDTTKRNGLDNGRLLIEPDADDRQTLYLRYPSATLADAYVAKAVKIESGAKSALDPNSVRTVRPYLQDDVPDTDLGVSNITIVDAQRTFWDKIVILAWVAEMVRYSGRAQGQRSTHFTPLL